MMKTTIQDARTGETILELHNVEQIDLSIEVIQRRIDNKPLRIVDIAPLMGLMNILKVLREKAGPS